ncbi:phytoene desaturase family protein [Sinomonas halotolerans]|uniref:Phytoene desaturase family protein n=1 Tax=Sinomonas halotolerans TaxID=1644133 RepID=A0ABU9X2Q5_9MICC
MNRPQRARRPARRQPRAVVVIGGGIAGLATAGLLARDGHAVQLLEQNHALGGRAGRWESGGFRFDTGPSWYLMPEVIDHWFRLMGTSAGEQLRLTSLDPAYRVFFEGQPAPVDVPAGREGAVALFESLDPGSGAALAAYLDEAEDAYSVALRHFLYNDFGSLRGLAHPEVLGRAARLAALLAQSLHGRVAQRFGDPRQRQILGYPAVFLGTTPYRAPALYQLMSHLDLAQGVLYPEGGFAALVDAMERLARAAGAQIHTGARATRIVTGPAAGRPRVEGVVWTDDAGREHRAGASVVVGAADLHHLETALLPEELQAHPERAWARRDPGPGAVLACLGVRGRLPELAHHSLFFASDWRDGFGRIGQGRAPGETTSVYVSRTSATDPGVAPLGDESLFVLVPSAAAPEWGRGGHDGAGSPAVEAIADAAVRQVAAWAGVPDLAERIAVRRTWGPADFAEDVNAWRGGALGLAHTLAQSAAFRPGNASPKVEGLLYAGASVRPGIGVPMCLISAELVLKRVRGDARPGPLGPPLAAPQAPGVTSQGPGVTSQGPGVTFQGRGVTFQGRGVTSQGRGVTFQGPGVTSQAPGATSANPDGAGAPEPVRVAGGAGAPEPVRVAGGGHA